MSSRFASRELDVSFTTRPSSLLILPGGVLGTAAAAAAEKDAALDVVLVVGHGRALFGRRFWLVVHAPRPLLLLRTRPWSRRLPLRESEYADMVEGCGLCGVVV
jgi:hypothetical protein